MTGMNASSTCTLESGVDDRAVLLVQRLRDAHSGLLRRAVVLIDQRSEATLAGATTGRKPVARRPTSAIAALRSSMSRAIAVLPAVSDRPTADELAAARRTPCVGSERSTRHRTRGSASQSVAVDRQPPNGPLEGSLLEAGQALADVPRPAGLPNSPSLTMSMPASSWRRTTSRDAPPQAAGTPPRRPARPCPARA